jgi:NAD dependent epimerase/dehydratase family
MSRVLVIGAQGVLGTFIAQAFSEAGWDVVRAGRRAEKAEDFHLLDLEDPMAIARAFDDADLIVNTAHHRELAPERAALRGGATLIDLIELNSDERRRLAGDAGEARGLVVADTGLGGIAYLAIADLLLRHPRANVADYSLMISASGSSGRAGALLGHTLLTGSSHHRTVKIPFPKPWGTRRCLEVGTGAASGVLRDTVGQVPVRHYICMQPRPLHGYLLALNAARLISLLPSAMFTAGTGKMPSEPTDEPICEWIAVSKDEKILAASTLEGHGYYKMTTAATLTFADALIQSPKAARGLLSIDQLVTLDAIAPALKEREISIRKQSFDS